MAEDVDLPLSVLNALPGVSGVEDVGFQVPDPEDIGTVLEEEIPPVVEQAFRDVDPEDILEDAIDAGQDPQQLAEDLATELPEQLEQVDVDIEAGLFGPTEEDLEGIISGTLEPPEPVGEARSLSFFELSSIVVNGEAQQGVTPTEAQAELDRRRAEQQDAGEEPDRDRFEITTLNPVEAIQQLSRDLGRLLADIQGSVDDILSFLQDDLLGEAADLSEALGDILEDAFPTIDGVSFLGDPVSFLGSAITEGVTAATPEEDLEELAAVNDELRAERSGGTDA